MKGRKNIVVLCSSPLQVVNAKSAIDYLYKSLEYNSYIVINHHQLTSDAVRLVESIAQKLGFSGVFNLSQYSLFAKRIRSVKALKYNPSTKCFGLILDKRSKLECIKKNIDQKIGMVDYVFCRTKYSKNDLHFIRACGQIDKIYGIEDGLADYISSSWKFQTLNKYELFLLLKKTFLKPLKVFVCIMLTRELRNSIQLAYSEKVMFENKFSNMEQDNKILIKDFFLKNMRNLYDYSNTSSNTKVLIIGTLMLNDRFGMSPLKEVEIYNAVIDRIVSTHQITHESIWYKPHPRLSKESWDLKKKYLKCSIYPLDFDSLSDAILCENKILAVYSVGSTSLFYAKEVFEKEAYLIDIRREAVHPSTFEVYYYIAKKLGIKIIDV